MRHRLHLLATLFICAALFSCRSKNTDNKNENNENTAISTGSPDCDFGVKAFNEDTSGRVIQDIRSIYTRHNSIPEDLRKLYPAAKYTWNSLLKDIKRNYNNRYQETSFKTLNTDDVKDWRNNNLDDSQKFFILLAVYKHGSYPEHSRDQEKIAGWMEKADIKKRFDKTVSHILIGNCNNTDSERVREKLNPIFLPDNIEDCYK